MNASTPAARPVAPFAIWNTRAAVLISALVLFMGVLFMCAPTAWITVTAVLLSDGLLAFGWTAAACALGAFVLRRTRIQTNPKLFLATAGGLGLGIFSLLGLILGLMGLLNRTTALTLPIISAVLLVVDLLLHRSEFEFDLRHWLLEPAGFSWLWLVPVVSFALMVVSASVIPGQLWKPLDPHPYDVLSYHLQLPREWYEAQGIVPLQHNVFSYFPVNVEMQFLMLMHVAGGPWNAMYACQFMSLAYTVLMIVGLSGAASSEGEPIIGAAIASAMPWVIMLAGVAYVESGLLLYTTLALAWALSSRSGADRAKLAVAGVMAGFACGVKITAVPMVLLSVPLALFITSLKRLSIIAGCAIFLAAGLLVLSPWLLRNLFWSGNPIFPVAMNVLGHAHFSLDQVERFRIAHSPTISEQSLFSRLSIVWNNVILHWQYGYLLLPAGLLAGVLRWRDRRTWILLITGTIMFIVWIGFTHLEPRFLIVVVPVAAILVGNFAWGKLRAISALLVLAAAGMGWVGVYRPLTEITHDPHLTALIGVRGDLSFFLPAELSDVKNSDMQVGLVGDAKAFLYQIPMTRLHYRTVFDVPADTEDPISAWVNPEAKGDPNWLLVIDPAEIERLHQTYWKIPPPLPVWEQAGEHPFVMRGNSK
jgi:hypothetical protein